MHFRGDLILHNYNVLCGSRFAVWHGNPELSCGFQCVLMWGLKMKMNSKAAAVLLSAAMAVSLPAAASAVAISLGSPGDFTFEDLKTANGNCPGGGKGCGLLNNNSAVTMSLKNGGTFTLDSISFRLEGNGTDNTFVITDGGNAKTASPSDRRITSRRTIILSRQKALVSFPRSSSPRRGAARPALTASVFP